MVVTSGSSSSYGQTVSLSIRSLASDSVALTFANADALTFAIIIGQRIPTVRLARALAIVIALVTAGKTCKAVNDLEDTIVAGVRHLSPQQCSNISEDVGYYTEIVKKLRSHRVSYIPARWHTSLINNVDSHAFLRDHT